MKPLLKSAAFVLLATALFCISCKKERDTAATKNQPPVADAGSDNSYYWPTQRIDLDGTASHDPDGSISTFRWYKLSGMDYLPDKIEDPFSAKTYIFNLNPGIHQFALSVTDNKGATARDVITITVIDTLTKRGKEYSFQDLIWKVDKEGFAVTLIEIDSLDLFYSSLSKIDVSVSLGNTGPWQTVPEYNQSLPKGALYYGVGGGSLVVVQTTSTPADNLAGTKASVRVRFL